MKSVHMIVIALLLFLPACTPIVTTDTPPETAGSSPSPTLIATAIPSLLPSDSQATPIPGLAHPVPFISEIRLYADIDVFTLEDLALGPITIASTQEDILQAIGDPDSITNDPFHVLGVVQTYHYRDCRIDFLLVDSVYLIQNCTVTEEIGRPRGISVSVRPCGIPSSRMPIRSNR